MRIRFVLLLIAIAIISSGCAGFKPPARWVENNTFYSTRLPSIEVKVNKSLPYRKSEAEDALAEGSRGNIYAGLNKEWFYFVNQGKANLGINVETLANQQRIYLSQLDWSKHPSTLIAAQQDIGGIDFSTGILREKVSDKPMLIKVYSTNVDDTTRYKIVYKEKVDSSWLTKTLKLLTSEDRDFLTNFNKRADESFSIAPYSGEQPPQPPAQ